MVFEEGKSLGVMGSYNRLGLLETAASYPLMTEVLRGEWGFKGSVLSDMTHSGNSSVNFKCYENVTWRVLAGCNCQLDSNGFSGQVAQQARWDANANGGKGAPVCVGGNNQIAWSLWNACREAVKQHMYMCVNSTLMQRGLTQVVGETDVEVEIGQKISFDVLDDLEALESPVTEGAIVNVYNSSNTKSQKEIATIDSIELNKRCELPDGITFEDGVLTCDFKVTQLARVDVVINVTFDDDTKGAIAYKYIIRVIPDEYTMDGDVKEPEVVIPPTVTPDKPKDEGCSMSIIAASALVSTLALAGSALLAFRRKKED